MSTALGLAACTPESEPAALDDAAADTADTGPEGDGRAGAVAALSPELESAWTAAVRRSPSPVTVLRPGEAATAPRTLVSSRALVAADGELLHATSEGALDEATRQRVARPYRHLQESTIYDMSAWFTSHDGKVLERGYEVYATPNPTPLEPQEYTGPVIVSDNLDEHVERVGPDGRLQLALRLRNFPPWDIPLPADERTASPADVETAAQARTQALATRSALFDSLRAPLEKDLAELDGKVIDGSAFTGWLYVDVPASALPTLRERREIQQIHSSDGNPIIPAGVLGDFREANRNNAKRFYDAGHDGAEPNPGRHSAGAVVIGITEIDGYESEARMFLSGPPFGSGTISRVIGKYRCDHASPNQCGLETTLESDINTPPPGGDQHGTQVASVAAGDYTLGQGNGQPLGEPQPTSWTNSICTTGADCASGICESGLCAHSTAWELDASGVARRARVRRVSGLLSRSRSRRPWSSAQAVACTWFLRVEGLSTTAGAGAQSRIPRDQRSGCRARARS